MSDLRERLQSALGEAYHLKEELGGGGMSHVFAARDTTLDRDVVVKVLRPDAAAVLSVERFNREVALSARLQHPNIVAVLTAGVTSNGLPYYTMPFVEGESLRARLARDGALPVPEAVSALKDVARALAYAHARGVVHRDVKPENVLLTGGAAVVVDFGIAKAVSAAGGAATLTQLDMAVGTPAYMAPEQAAGQADVDSRADLYAWGMVAWELLVGQHPFAPRTTPHALIAAHFLELPASVTGRRPSVPPHVADVVMRCLEKDPDQRPASAAEVLLALDVGAVSAVPQAAPAATGAGSAARDGVPEGSIAVLPFANQGPEDEDEYLSDGMTEEVINALARLPGVRVAARTSAFVFKGQRVDLRSIGAQLRVATVLEGSVRRVGRRIRVSAQLASAADGLHLWSQRYDRELTDVFALQDEIADAIAGALGERLGTAGHAPAPPAAPAAPAPPAVVATRGRVSPEAYEQYLRGRFLGEQGGASMLRALAHLERATVLAPDFPDAHSWLGMTCTHLAVHGMLPAHEAFARARLAADRALDLEPEHAHALTVRLLVALWFDWDGAAAEALGRRAVSVGDGVAAAHEVLGWALLAGARFDEAEAEMLRALALDPLSASTRTAHVFSRIMGRRPEAAVPAADEWLARSPLDAEFHRLRGLALEAADRLPAACDAFRRASELDPANRFARGDLAATLAVMGRRDEARLILNAMDKGAGSGQPPAMMLALVHHAFDDDALAFTWLDRALDDHEFWLSMMHVDPMFRRMRGDARFEALVRRVGVARAR